MESLKKYISRKEASELLGVHVQTIDIYRKKGYLKSFGIGSRVLLNREQVESALIDL